MNEPLTPAQFAQVVARALDWRQVRILSERVAAEVPKTLEQLGEVAEVTRERIRQLETQSVKHMREQLSAHGPSVDLLDQITALAAPVVSLSRLESLDGFCEVVPRLGLPAGRLLIGLADDLEVEGQWVARGPVAGARAETSRALKRAANTHGALPVVDAARVLPTLNLADMTAWLDMCKMRIWDGHVLTQTATQADIAAAVLSIVGEPVTCEWMLDDPFEGQISLRGFRQRIQTDERFVRSGKKHYALAEWGVETYSTVTDAIHHVLNREGGPVPLVELQRELSAKFGIQGSSVAAYASDNLEFRVVAGKVHWAKGEGRRSDARRRTRRMYRRPHAWVYRIVLNRDHVRGSGTLIPSPLAAAVGLTDDRRMKFRWSGGEVGASWGRQPSLGSIRALVAARSLREGDQAFVVFGDDGTIDLEPVGSGPSNLVGGGQLGAKDLWPRIAAALDTEETDPLELVRTLVLDGDEDVVALLPTDGMMLLTTGEPWAQRANTLLLNGHHRAEVADKVGVRRPVLRQHLLDSRAAREAGSYAA